MTWVYHFQSSTTDSLQKHLTSKTTFDKISQPIRALDDKERRHLLKHVQDINMVKSHFRTTKA